MLRTVFFLLLIFKSIFANSFFIEKQDNELFFFIKVDIAKGKHTYSQDNQYSATKFELLLNDKIIKTQNVIWKKPITNKENSQIYENDFTISGKIASDKNISNNFKAIKAKIDYILCDEESCEPISLTLNPIEKNLHKINKDKNTNINFISLLYMCLFAIIGGILLNLMPCVLPVLSLKIFGILQSGNKKELKVSAIFFAIGNIASFLILALILYYLKTLGNDLGWGFQLQSHYNISLLILLFSAIALNLFEVFEVGLSLTKAGNIKTDTKNIYISSFFHGALTCIVASPCSAPFMGTAIGFAFSKSLAEIILIFTSLGIGVALPYILICNFNSLQKILPKPGNWMHTFKKFLGFAMLCSVLWLFDILKDQANSDIIFNTLCSIVMLAFALFLYGKYLNHSHTSKIKKIIILITFALFVFFSIFNIFYENKEKFYWNDYSPQNVEQSLKKQPVFIDFTANWCLTCQLNKKIALNTDAVQAEFKKRNVKIFKADWTNKSDEISKMLKKHNRNSVPFYLLILPNKKEVILPQILTKDIVINTLKEFVK